MSAVSNISSLSKARRKRTRSGCVVCKARHIKCDETRPACDRCEAAQWDCHYTEPGPNRRRSPQPRYAYASSSLSEYRPTSAVSHSVIEQRSFHYFHRCLAQDRWSCFESDTWYDLVLQVSRSEPAVRHSVYALGSLFEAKVASSNAKQLGGLASTDEASLTKFCLKQYTKAVGLLANELSSGRCSEQIALILCLLFISIEMIQCNLDAALDHLQSGLNIIQSLRQPSVLHSLDKRLHHAFKRLHAQARLHGSPTSAFNRQAPNVCVAGSGDPSSPFENLVEARHHLDTIGESAYRVMREVKNISGSCKVARSVLVPTLRDPRTRIEVLQLDLQKWRTRFENLPDCASARPARTQVAAAASLELQYTFTYIFLEGVLEASETLYDKHTALFQRILALSENLISVMQSEGYFKLSLDSGIIAPLFLVAMKCRNVELRMRAISLLRCAPEQEGMWHRDNVVAVALWKLRMEKGPDDSGLIPAHARVHSEKAATTIVDGKQITTLQYLKGNADPETAEQWEVETISIPSMMGGDIL